MISRLKKNFCGKNSRAHPQSLGTNRFCIYQKCITSLCEFVYIYILYTSICMYKCLFTRIDVLQHCIWSTNETTKLMNGRGT